MRTTVTKMVLAAAGVLLVSGCGAQTVDIDKLEGDIKSGVKEQNNLDVDVKCPDSVDWKTGGSFTCDVTQKDGTTDEATVDMKNDDGDVEWRVGNP